MISWSTFLKKKSTISKFAAANSSTTTTTTTTTTTSAKDSRHKSNQIKSNQIKSIMVKLAVGKQDLSWLATNGFLGKEQVRNINKQFSKRKTNQKNYNIATLQH